jgi:hypothetical protein
MEFDKVLKESPDYFVRGRTKIFCFPANEAFLDTLLRRFEAHHKGLDIASEFRSTMNSLTEEIESLVGSNADRLEERFLDERKERLG